MQKSINSRTTNISQLMSQRNTYDKNQQTSTEMKFCPISYPEDEKRHEIDVLIKEYYQLKYRLAEVSYRLQQLGFH